MASEDVDDRTPHGVVLAARDAAQDPAFAGQADLTWLLHRAAQRMRAALDDAARSHGLAGARDWLVLSAIATGPPQTPLSRSHASDEPSLTQLSNIIPLSSHAFPFLKKTAPPESPGAACAS